MPMQPRPMAPTGRPSRSRVGIMTTDGMANPTWGRRETAWERVVPGSRLTAMTSSLSRLTARAGRWSAAHRRLAIAGWLAFVVLAVVGGNLAGFKEGNDADGGTGSSGRADRILDRAFPETPSESVIVEGAGAGDVARRLRAADGVRSVAAKRRGDATLLTVRYSGEVAPVLAATKAAARAHPGS